jgi:hypothetical protein
LKKDPKERLTAAQALEHPWFKMEISEEKALDVSNFKFRDVSDQEKSTGGAANKLLITCTPLMAGRKLQDLPPATPFMTGGWVSNDRTPIM